MTLTRKQMRERITSGPTFWMGGAYDALSALLVDQSDFDGVFTTGFGISASLLGQPDVELYTLTENLGVVNRVTNVVTKPVFADADTGYGNVINVMRTVREFEKVGPEVMRSRICLRVRVIGVLSLETSSPGRGGAAR